MEDLGILLFIGILLFFSVVILYTAEKFKGRALKRKGISNKELKGTIWRMVQFSIWAGFALGIVYVIDSLLTNRPLWNESLLCLIGPGVFAGMVFVSYVAYLWGAFRLPIIDEDDEETETN